nr:hypothetical protein [uncultured Cupriavidus sp.]
MPEHSIDTSPRFHVDLSIDTVDGRARFNVSGWVCCRVDVHKLYLRSEDIEVGAPIGFPRPDVHKAINADGSFPFFNSYFCGVNSEFHLTDEQLARLRDGGMKAVFADREGLSLRTIEFRFDDGASVALSG